MDMGKHFSQHFFEHFLCSKSFKSWFIPQVEKSAIKKMICFWDDI